MPARGNGAAGVKPGVWRGALAEFPAEVVREMLQGLRGEAAPGVDGVPNALVKELAALPGGVEV
eukprot:11564473-Prorocentrum_lima.AAC.1